MRSVYSTNKLQEVSDSALKDVSKCMDVLKALENMCAKISEAVNSSDWLVCRSCIASRVIPGLARLSDISDLQRMRPLKRRTREGEEAEDLLDDGSQSSGSSPGVGTSPVTMPASTSTAFVTAPQKQSRRSAPDPVLPKPSKPPSSRSAPVQPHTNGRQPSISELPQQTPSPNFFGYNFDLPLHTADLGHSTFAGDPTFAQRQHRASSPVRYSPDYQSQQLPGNTYDPRSQSLPSQSGQHNVDRPAMQSAQNGYNPTTPFPWLMPSGRPDQFPSAMQFGQMPAALPQMDRSYTASMHTYNEPSSSTTITPAENLSNIFDPTIFGLPATVDWSAATPGAYDWTRQYQYFP